VSGRGTLHTFTVVERGQRGFPLGPPYIIAIVELDEGARVMTNLVDVEPDPRFERHGEDLVTRVDVPFTDAALGTTLRVPTLTGEEEVELKAGTQPATVLRLRGRGLPQLRGRRTGDLHVIVNVLVPARLSDEQRELLLRFRESANGDTYPAPKGQEGFFDRIRHAFRA
jgi:molecular chaperone DnaJ